MTFQVFHGGDSPLRYCAMWSVALVTEAARVCKGPTNFCEIMRRSVPEGCYLPKEELLKQFQEFQELLKEILNHFQ
jgi:hypothetical protein